MIDAGAGDDLVRAGDGNDTVEGGAGDDILIGGDGDDHLVGYQGRDLLIGGQGAEGFTAYDDLDVPLLAIMAEWTRPTSYSSRVANIQAGTGLTGGYRLDGNDGDTQTVFNDNAVDMLTGNQGTDWFFANLVSDNGGVLDVLTDLAGNEEDSDMDF